MTDDPTPPQEPTPPPVDPGASVAPTLAAALVSALGELRNVAADARADVRTDKGNYSYAYATLGQVLELARPVLARHALAIVQIPLVADPRSAGVRTIVLHASGAALETELLLPVTRADAQGVGSALTYARRYALAALLGIATDDDDDGQAACAPPSRRSAEAREEREPRRQSRAPERPARSGGAERRISDAQRRRLFAVAAEAGTAQGFDRADVEARVRALLATHGYEHSGDVLARDYDALVSAIAGAFTDGPGAAAASEGNPFD
ncbi:MAG: ERF family protein [Deltaproteobacteria bacterium]|nr:ERF family protein [Deltaproteobacteria bacterium]